MATYGKCACGKRVMEKKDGTPRAHICNAPGGPEWAVSAQPVVPADVDETDPFTTPTATEFTERTGDSAKGPWVEARYANTLDCGHDVLTGDEIRADGEGGWECQDCGVDQEEASYATPDQNWNGTGRPRPSAATVKMPEPEPQEDKPRLLDMLAAGAAGAGTVLDQMTPEQQSAAIGAQQMADAFTAPTPQGSGPRRGAAPATHTGVPAMHSGAAAVLQDQDMRDAAGLAGVPAPDPFSTPTHVAPPLGSATDQPETERDQWGRYVIKDPRTGDFKRSRSGKPQGFTRATTYGKALLDQFHIHQWEMRSVLAGLALRPDLVARAQGLDVAADKDLLNAIAAEAKDAAGGNEAADDGTEFHTVTEWIDTGKMDPENAPEKFRAEALAYAGKMSTAGLSTEFGWIERVTFTDRGGEDVAGTADRILRERSGQLVVGDVKSGKGIDLAQREIVIQLKVYAMGINQFGLYNKSTKQWEPWTGPPVSEEYAIVMHVPVVRPEGTEAYCDLYRIDLRGVPPYEVSSAMHAAAWVREWRKQKGFASPYQPPAAWRTESVTVTPESQPVAPTRTWAEAFSTVTTPEEANRLWQAAVDAGMGDVDLASNVALARRALATPK